MDPNKTFIKKTSEVEAVQFKDWLDAVTTLEWLAAPAYFVPVGYEHRFRSPAEYGTNGIRPEAVSFLVVLTDDGWTRVDSGGWVVRENGTLHAYSAAEFAETYDKKAL